MVLIAFNYFQDDFVVKKEHRQKLASYDKQLRKFEYSKVLDSVMDVGYQWGPVILIKPILVDSSGV
jgi:hypothetical protein